MGEDFVPILERYVWFIPASAFLSLLSSTLEGLGIGLLIPLLTELLGDSAPASGGPAALLQRVSAFFPPAQRTLGVAACIFALILLKAGILTLYWTIVAWVDGKAGHEIRAALSQRLLSLDYAFFLRHAPARLVTIVSTESWRASDAIRLAFTITASAGAVVVFSAFLFAVSWQLAVLVVLGVLAIRTAQLMFSRRLARLSDRVAATNQELASRMLTVIDAMRLIRVFGQQNREQARFEGASEAVRKALLDVERSASVMTPLFEVLHAALFIAILLVAQVIDVALPALITFLALLYRMQPHLMGLNNARLGLAALRGPLREVGWLLNPPDAHSAARGTLPFAALDQPIVFENVAFSYASRDANEPTLADLNFTVQPKRALAVLGASGSGKTTLVNLICRLLTPSAGRISIAGCDVARIDPAAWLRHVALAGQDIDLIDGTIADNIAYGLPDASIEQIQQAAEMADAASFIATFPDGYSTTVGSRGLSLSGGQRQRIGIARALIKNPDLLILDEATNAVDGISEAAIMKLIERRAGNQTTIVISHRQSTIAACQDGVVLERGRLVEAGPLSQLAFVQHMAGLPPG